MRKILTALVAELSVLLAPCASARRPEVARPALWKVADADTTIYLFGTVHALPPDIIWYRGKISAAFERSQELVTEIIAGNPAETQRLLLSRAALPESQTLRAALSDGERAKYEAALAQLGLPTAALDRVEPWFAAITLATLPIMRSGYAVENGVESLLDARAKALGRPHSALETEAFQLDLFDTLPPQVQRRYLMEVVDQLPGVADDLGKIVAAWKAGDADKLARLINEQEDDPELMETLVLRRNRAWADWIGQRLDKPGTVFIAVGAGHLAGPGSVQEELRRRGFASVRVQ